MRKRSRTRLSALLALIGLLGVLAPLALAPTAQATHEGGTLEVTPEVTSVTAGTGVTLQARFTNAASQAALAARTVEVDLEYEGGPADPDGVTPETPDATCLISVPANNLPASPVSCQVTITAASPGKTFVRAWIDHDRLNQDAGGVTEADTNEGRFAADPGDCTTEGSAAPGCRSGSPVPGGPPTTEPDGTDVVEVTWSGALAKLDCSPEQGKAPRSGSATVTCVAADADGNRVKGVRVDGENVSGANDPDQTNGGTADYNDFCNGATGTDDNGTCTGSINAVRPDTGLATICFWAEASGFNDAYSPAGGNGAAADGGQCNAEAPADAENDNVADKVQISWETRRPTVVDASPEGPAASAVGTNHTISTDVRDQFGEFWTSSNVIVHFELFSGSPNDIDGNSPATDDQSCSTNPGGETGEDAARCGYTYSSNNAGTDRWCVWIDLDPTSPEVDRPGMSGTNTNGTCQGEELSGNAHDAVDLVSKQWTSSAGGGPTPPPSGEGQGYWLNTADGGVFAFGEAKSYGSAAQLNLNKPIVGMASTKSGEGYWLVATDGGVFSFGDAKFHGSTGAITLNKPIVGMARTKSGQGYWMVASDGGIFAFGDAAFHGSTGAITLNKPIVGMAVTETGNGYWLVATDGGIFAFGDAAFHGSTGAITLNQPVVGMERTKSGQGYWMVASDGGVFSFGDAKFYGSTGAIKLAQPIIGMGRTPSGEGYWMGAKDGGIFSFGDASFKGSAAGFGVNNTVDFESKLPS